MEKYNHNINFVKFDGTYSGTCYICSDEPHFYGNLYTHLNSKKHKSNYVDNTVGYPRQMRCGCLKQNRYDIEHKKDHSQELHLSFDD